RIISNDKYLNDQEIIVDWTKDNSTDGLRRISQNASIGQLSIKLWPFRPFTREVYSIIKNFDVDDLILDCE
ncbi:hypothetical protein PMAYCL1PPCAC_27863, partial [Pristionchus mayeri]